MYVKIKIVAYFIKKYFIKWRKSLFFKNVNGYRLKFHQNCILDIYHPYIKFIETKVSGIGEKNIAT